MPKRYLNHSNNISYQIFNGHFIARESMSDYGMMAYCFQEGMVSKGFSLFYIRNVYFNDRIGNGTYTICKCDASMCISSCIEYDTYVVIKAYFLKFIYKSAFMIGLKVFELGVLMKYLFEFKKECIKCLVSINLGLSHTKEVEIGAVDDYDFFHLSSSLLRS